MIKLFGVEGEDPLPSPQESINPAEHTRFVAVWRRDILGLRRFGLFPIIVSRNGATVLGELRA